MRNISAKNCRENENTHFMFNDFFPKIVPCMKMWKKYGMAGQATYDDIIRHMYTACWITNATDTHSEYVIIIASPRQQWYANAHPCYVVRTLPVLINSLKQDLLSGSQG
jgi:hypothetical protein